MTDVLFLHTPRWQPDGDAWHLMVGNRSVAWLIPNSDEKFPQYHWLSVIDGDEFPDHGWHAVDFETLEIAQYDLGQWWIHMRSGETYSPHHNGSFCAFCGC
jgi:hypothetical protein